MIFSSSIFLFAFLPAVLILYFIVGKKLKNWVLLLASLCFYAWGEPVNVLVMIASILVNYAGCLWMAKAEKKKPVLVLLLILNIGTLFYFKYLNFAVETWSALTGLDPGLREVALPIGISFFTFQIMSYVIDVYRGKVEAQKNVVSLGLYISLFPQLIAGPIVRYSDIEKEIRTRTVTIDKVYEGLRRFAIGFAKKVIIADQLGALVDTVFAGRYPSVWGNWIGILAYTLQIYYDFSGYSDMAIGLGRCFGFTFLENFNYPYISRSVREFWRRWHMSLSGWFRDYLYIPLGGSRKGTARTYLNLLIVFFVTGLWHGASFNFIVWGLYYGLFLIIERIGFGKVLDKAPRILGHIYTLLIVIIGWVFFRADTLGDALIYLQHMVIPFGNDLARFRMVMDARYWFILALGILCALPYQRLLARVRRTKAGTVLADAAVILIFLLAISFMFGSGYSPFLYFRF